MCFQFSAAVVKELWEQIFLDFTNSVNLEVDNEGRDRNDSAYHKINATRMDQLSFLRPCLFNPPHQVSSMLQEASKSEKNSDKVGRLCGGGKLVLPPLSASEEEEEEMNFEESDSEEPDVSGGDGNCSYQEQLRHLFDQVIETERTECFFAVTQSLDQLLLQSLN